MAQSTLKVLPGRWMSKKYLFRKNIDSFQMWYCTYMQAKGLQNYLVWKSDNMGNRNLKTLNSKHRCLGSLVLQCLCWPLKPKLRKYLVFYILTLKKKVGILGYEFLVCIKNIVLNLPSLKNLFTQKVTMLSAVLVGRNCKYFIYKRAVDSFDLKSRPKTG